MNQARALVDPTTGFVDEAEPTASRGAGRPRDGRVDRDVLEATRALLVEVGYPALTIDAIARRANVSRPAIYRRWKTKAQLVHEAVYPDADQTLQLPDTGDFAADLRTIVSSTVAIFSRPEVLAAIPGLLADQRDDPELRERLALRLEADARAQFAVFIEAAVARGDARPGLRGDVLFDAFAGAALFRIVAGSDEIDVAVYAAELGDLLLHSARPDRTEDT